MTREAIQKIAKRSENTIKRWIQGAAKKVSSIAAKNFLAVKTRKAPSYNSVELKAIFAEGGQVYKPVKTQTQKPAKKQSKKGK